MTKTGKCKKSFTEFVCVVLDDVVRNLWEKDLMVLDSQWMKNPKCEQYYAPITRRKTDDCSTGFVTVAYHKDGGVTVHVLFGQVTTYIPSYDFNK